MLSHPMQLKLDRPGDLMSLDNAMMLTHQVSRKVAPQYWATEIEFRWHAALPTLVMTYVPAGKGGGPMDTWTYCIQHILQPAKK